VITRYEWQCQCTKEGTGYERGVPRQGGPWIRAADFEKALAEIKSDLCDLSVQSNIHSASKRAMDLVAKISGFQADGGGEHGK
jgi:hypothetical protein